jgi:hypothetical protein
MRILNIGTQHNFIVPVFLYYVYTTLNCTYKNTIYKTVIQLVAMVGLSLKEISSSQSMDVQDNKLRKHKSSYLHTYISLTLYPEGVAEASQILLRGPSFTKIT